MINQTYALNDVVVLDLTDEKGVYTGKLLADMGATVIRIEPPSGNKTRGTLVSTILKSNFEEPSWVLLHAINNIKTIKNVITLMII